MLHPWSQDGHLFNVPVPRTRGACGPSHGLRHGLTGPIAHPLKGTMLLLDGEDVLIRIYIYICIYNDDDGDGDGDGDDDDDNGGGGENVVTRKFICFWVFAAWKHCILFMFWGLWKCENHVFWFGKRSFSEFQKNVGLTRKVIFAFLGNPAFPHVSTP